MAVVDRSDTDLLLVSPGRRAELVRLAGEADAQAGIVGEATVTAEVLQARQRAHGIRPENSGATRELLRMRYGDDGEQE